jgi:hypothetical protein
VLFPPLRYCRLIQASPFIADGEADVALWNKEIAKYFQGMNTLKPRFNSILTSITGKTFMNAPWLVAEAYKYRRLRECFAVSKYWKEYDVFFRQKVCAGMMDAYATIVV